MKGQLASKRRMLFINLIDEILLLMWDMDKGPRKTLFREVLTCFLKEYSNVAKTTGRAASKDIVFYFRSSNAVEDGSRLRQIIDEMLIDEAYLLNEIDLKKINYEKNKNILIKNLIKAGFGGIIPENEENPSTNMDLIFDNIDFIQKVLNNVKQNEKDMKIKYNIK